MLSAAAQNKVPERTTIQLYQPTRAGEAEKAEEKQYLMIYNHFIGETMNAAPPNGGEIPRML